MTNMLDGLGVLPDPTRYAPPILAWTATRLHWYSSQAFFENGWSEQNARYTVSGLSNDPAIGYAAGNQRILIDALANLQLSLINNASMQSLSAC